MTAIGQPASALIKALALRGRPHKTLRPNSSVSWAERASSWVTKLQVARAAVAGSRRAMSPREPNPGQAAFTV